MNQCDGCRTEGSILVNGIHYLNGYAYMVCCKDDYVEDTHETS